MIPDTSIPPPSRTPPNNPQHPTERLTFLLFVCAVVGMVGSIYNVETVLTASRVIEALGKKEDPSVQVQHHAIR